MSSRLKLFGGASIETAEGPLVGRAAQRHRLGLLALLASTRRPARNRDQLVALLWPEAGVERGRHLLSDSVYRINQALGVDAVLATGDDLRLNHALLPGDLSDFERALVVGDGRQAVALYTGAFLDGFFLPNAVEFERWAEEERRSYAVEAGRAIEGLAEEAERESNWHESIEWWRRLAVLAPDNSRVAVRYMEALAAGGDRAAAIKHARLHTVLLRESFGIEADPAVARLADCLRDGSADRAAAKPAAPRPSVASAAAATPVEPVHTSPMGADTSVAPPREVPVASRMPWRALVATGLAIAAAAAGWRFIGVKEAQPGSTVPTVAVLPFRNVSPSDSVAFFADGMTDELIYMIGRSPAMRVLSRTSTFAFRDSVLDAREIGNRLGADWVVSGSVRRDASTLRISAELTSTNDGVLLWSDSYDRALADVFAIQEEIASAIAQRVQQRAGGEAATPPVFLDRGVNDPAVYDLYLEARFHWHRRTEDGLQRAVDLLERTVERAPDYARGWVGLGDAYAVSGFYDLIPPREAFPRAEAAARRALVLDPSLAAAHATIGYVNLYHHWDWQAAEQEFRQSIAMDPTYSTAHQWLGNLLTALGKFEEAEREMRIAQQLDPLSLIANAALGWVHLIAGQNDRAVEQLRRTLALNSDFQLAYLWIGIAEDQRGRSAESIEALESAVRLSRGNALSLGALAHALARRGSRDSAEALVAALRQREQAGQYLPSFEVAKALIALGDTTGALDRLERAYSERAHSMAFLKVDPQLEPIRLHPRYRALLARVGLE